MEQPQQFAKEPIPVWAMQWTGENLQSIQEWCGVIGVIGGTTLEVYDKLHDSWIKVFLDQWILQGTEGEFYAHDDALFRKNYRKVN